MKLLQWIEERNTLLGNCVGSLSGDRRREIGEGERLVIRDVAESSALAPLMIGIGIAGVLFIGSGFMRLFAAWKSRPKSTMLGSSFYEGGFNQTMDKREASRILGVR